MGVKTHKPTTPTLRFQITSDFKEITKKRPVKRLLEPMRKTGGRNAHGRITSRFMGGGHKQQYRRIDFYRRDKIGVPAKVLGIEYDPNRSSRISLLEYADQKGAGWTATGHRGAQMVRSAGSWAIIQAKEGPLAHVKLPSGEIRLVHQDCWATIGQVGNSERKSTVIGKAGRSRWLGRMPHVRGIAMNPIDHPHGGGEGKSGQGNPHPVSPWGWHTKGRKTRNPNKYSNRLIVMRKGRS
ncbi:MAG: 50S ribosomal protein L2 [Candidatus Omnitrophica bacterium]|nr:50S ribosomal protein L2 [Candidatus Omnitrophota bacterium]